MEQRWFAGVHANIGGGYADSRLSDIALKWMMDKAEDTGLCFHDPLTVDINAHYSGKITESYRLHYKFWLPIWRSIDLLNEKHNLTIDDTVWTRYHQTDLKYRPKNLHKISTNQLKN